MKPKNAWYIRQLIIENREKKYGVFQAKDKNIGSVAETYGEGTELDRAAQEYTRALEEYRAALSAEEDFNKLFGENAIPKRNWVVLWVILLVCVGVNVAGILLKLLL